MFWANLLHLSFNMWEEQEAKSPRGSPPRLKALLDIRKARPYLRFDELFWQKITGKMAQIGMNMVVIDLGDGLQYQSHPEIAVNGAWSVNKLRKELVRLQTLGLEPIPKLNFSTTHDTWLGPYSRCVSTDAYYAVCRDLIDEVCNLFHRPRFFHLGMDEETASHQSLALYAVMRQHQLWWHDFYFLVEQVEKNGVRAWVWSDYLWHQPEVFFRKMPRSVVQSNWYYGKVFNRKIPYVKAYLDLEQHGYDQIPTGSNWSFPENFEKTVAYCLPRISPGKLLGFLQTPWYPTLPGYKQRHYQAIKGVEIAIRKVATREGK
ncbi:MAG: Tat pathway signal protein [Candidatus Omnitrophica bacterium]|nr:Tat pathway signal protein [Candidatus Omnitrophota bacterium]